MTETIKAKVAEHHFKGHVSVGDTTLVKEESREVEPNITVRNMVKEGNVIVTEGSLSPDKEEKSFQEDDESGEEGEKDVVECAECGKEFESVKGRKSHARQVH